MGSPLYCRPSDILAPSSVTVTAGAADARYQASQLVDGFAHKVSRSTGTTITYRLTFASAVTLQAIAFIHTNATAIQVTNDAGLNEAVTIPTTPEDGLPLDPWHDLRAIASGIRTSDTWDIALTGPAGVGLGEVLPVETLRVIDLEFSSDRRREAHPTSIGVTDYGVRLKYGMSVRQRGRVGTAWGAPGVDSVMSDLLSLHRDARGALKQFLLIPDSAVNDALYVDLTTDLAEFQWPTSGYQALTVTFTEQQKGLAL